MAKIGIISLGCPRNLVDSEAILGIVKKGRHDVVDIEASEIAIINTCSFIEDAKKESIETILELVNLKKEGKIKGIIVAGCLAQRYKTELAKELKDVDGFIGVGDLEEINISLDEILKGKRSLHVSDKPGFAYKKNLPRVPLTPSHYRYLKIQEGCGNECSFCIIPKIKGPLRSRPIESILEEVKAFSDEVSEINIVGQDTTLYGLDLYKEKKITTLLKEILSIKKASWIRLLYGHPSHVDDALIELIKNEPRICKYLDLPLQHINDRILKSMKRYTTKKAISSLIEKVRNQIPGLALRTSFVVGFPGETEKEFKGLVDFVKDIKFERLGVFTYSQEEGTPAAGFPGQIPEDVKLARFNELMTIQQAISENLNKRLLGKEIEAIVDKASPADANVYMGRTRHDAPEVDGQVWIKGGPFRQGEIIKVKITDTLEYDLVGEAK